MAVLGAVLGIRKRGPGSPANAVPVKGWSFLAPDPRQAAASANLDLAYTRRLGQGGRAGMVRNEKSDPYSISYKGDLGALQSFKGGDLFAKTRGVVDSRDQALPITNPGGQANQVLRTLWNNGSGNPR